MSGYEIREVDVHDEEDLHRWWQTSHDGAMHGRPYDIFDPWEHTRIDAPKPHEDWERVRLSALDEDRVVGTGVVHMPQFDNLAHAYLEVTVPPGERRRGVGSAVLARIEEVAADRGRSVLICEALAPPGGTVPGEAFALAHGYALANREGLKVLDLRAHAGTWGPLDEQVAERIGAYRLEEWGLHTPDDRVDDVCAALNRFMGMVPTGDLEMEDLDFSPERLRRNEARAVDLGHTRFVAAAVAPDGTMAGYHDLFVQGARTSQAGVGITMVLPEHRGHSLGLAMKLATHRSLMAALPECEIVRTGNADVNEHMNAVNQRMGYELVEQILEFQKKR